MRSLTLLNNDYKILAKALDNRLWEVLPLLISNDQTGFIKGLQDLPQYKKIPGCHRLCSKGKNTHGYLNN